MISELLTDRDTIPLTWEPAARSRYVDDVVITHGWSPCDPLERGVMKEMAILALSHRAPTCIVIGGALPTSDVISSRFFRYFAAASCRGAAIKQARARHAVTIYLPQVSDWLRIAQSTVSSLTFDQIGVIIDDLSKHLGQSQFDRIDHELSAANPHRMSADAVVAVARTTYAARAKLSHWQSFVSAAKAALVERGERAPVLAGLA